MMSTHRSDCDDRCNGDWCTCSCHQQPRPTEQELREQKAAIETEAAKLRQLHDRLGDTGQEEG
jgi:hypothetical protein